MWLTLVLTICLTFQGFLSPTVQAKNSRHGRSPRIGQRSFYLDEAFKHPVKIPESVIQTLRQEAEKQCPQRIAGQGDDIRTWFSAAALDLNDDGRGDLIVTSKERCLNGADNDWFWIFRNTGRGYQLALKGGTFNVTLLRAKTHGFRDIETDGYTAAATYTNIYKFNGRAYKPRKCTATDNGTNKTERLPCER
jgi:hypothetical protein